MEINANKLREQRQARGWTQQHLADAAGLSLRTIQRAENQGSAAAETLLSLCATLEIERSQLSLIPHPRPEELTEAKVGPLLVWFFIAWASGLLVGVVVSFWFFG